MPHVPRRYPSMGGPPPESQAQAQPRRQPPPPAQPEQQATGRRKIGLGRISLRDYEPSQETLYRAMFGRQPDIDTHTGRMTLPREAPGDNGKS